MLKFDDFVKTFSSLSAWEYNPYARYVYEEIIGREDIRVKMVLASEAGDPALSVCASEIEAYCSTELGCDLDLSNHTVRQSIGRMVKEAMRPLGYQPCSKGSRLSAVLGLTYFQTASCYHREKGTLRVTVQFDGVENIDTLTCTF